ncbi:hypothetical protein GCM10022243_51550 [Saccharothrix violaceirubra]|uniref:Lipoprotein n=1 Tax=Saccharothrix violaceirubra TaxID=413306 RepID=A0A7W7WZF4_9PSEU|nr:hypothetical protein [Saccharothrix violaceirubra]MBB4969544.1 hypothetical protein [Saccharothrix violaceirubra]
MKLLRLLPLVALVFLLVGCSSEWEGDVRFKVTKLNPGFTSSVQVQAPYANLEIDEAEPKSTLEPVSKKAVDISDLPEGVQVGDVVICHVSQHDKSGFDQQGVQVKLDQCRRP